MRYWDTLASIMSLIYITGAPGIGKTTILKELVSRGCEAYDLDGSKLGGAHNKSSGERVTIPSAEDRSPTWFDEHEWRIDVDAVKALLEKAADKPIYICGVSEDDDKIIDLFDKIFYLKLDDETLQNRISERTDNDYGKNESELQDILDRKRKLDLRYKNSAAVIVDATKTPTTIVDYILANSSIE